MATNEDIYALLQQVADALGATEGAGGGYGDYDADGYPDEYGTYGQGTGFSLYATTLEIQRLLQERLDVPVSSREPALKEPGQGAYFVGRIVKDDTTEHLAISNALVEARYSGTSEIIRSTRTNTEGKFLLFFSNQNAVDIVITSDNYQGTVIYGVIPQPY